MVFELLKLLSDGKFHSGETLASSLNVSRTAIWKMISRLREFGLELHSVKGKGYRLQETLDLLDRESLLQNLPVAVRNKIGRLEIFPSILSTSSYMMQKAQARQLDLANKKVAICLAEQQTGGRGRRGRSWVSPFGHNLYLTLAREFNHGISELEGLSLVVGLALIRVLRARGYHDLGIKWPNDVLWQGRKLAGILIEISGDPTGFTQVMIGLGLNIRVAESAMQEVEQAWVDLYTINQHLPERNVLAAELLTEIIDVIESFEMTGFNSFRQEWDSFDVLKNFEVELLTGAVGAGHIVGKVLGVDAHGALQLETANGIETFHGGEISPRMRKHANP